MTVITWDGEVLSVDSRRRKNGEMTSDEARKIDLDFPLGRVHKKKVLAVASAGNVGVTKKMKEALRGGKDLEKVYGEMYLNGELKDTKKGTLFIVSAKNAWTFKVRPGEAPELTSIGNKLFASGTGGKIAMYMMETFSLSPQFAVAATMLHMKCCGGPVRYYKRHAKRVATIPFFDRDELQEVVFDAVRKRCRRAREPA